MIDLAGSERFAKTNATPQQLKEANSINKSLSGKLIKIKRQGKTALKGCSFINQLLDLPINSILPICFGERGLNGFINVNAGFW